MITTVNSSQKIGIIDDDQAYVESFQKYFNYNTKSPCIFSSPSLSETLQHDKASFPELDILFLDIMMPGILGTEGLARLKKIFPSTEIIMLTVVEDEHHLIKALCSGASGYLLKEINFEGISTQITHLKNNGSPLSPKMARYLVNYFGPKQTLGNNSILSEKNQHVLHLLAEGWAYKTIADRMSISIDGVRYHIKEIYRTLGVQSVAQAVRKYADGDLPTR